MARLAGVMLRRSVPAISGESIAAHRLNSDWYSVVVMSPLPTSSMSGSFQAPGPEYGYKNTFCWKFDSMLP